MAPSTLAHWSLVGTLALGVAFGCASEGTESAAGSFNQPGSREGGDDTGGPSGNGNGGGQTPGGQGTVDGMRVSEGPTGPTALEEGEDTKVGGAFNAADSLTACSQAGQPLVRRLTSVQFRNTLGAIFGNSDAMLNDLFNQDVLSDPEPLGLNVDANGTVEGLGQNTLSDFAFSVAERAVAALPNDVLGVTCENLGDQNCRTNFIRTFGKKVARGPLADAQVQRLDALMRGNRQVALEGQMVDVPATASWDEGVTLVIAALLQSPSMLYRSELGTPSGNGVQLTQHEIASEISYMLTDGPPDAMLMAAADGNQLNAQGIQSHVGRLMNSEAGDRMLTEFIRGWLDVRHLQEAGKADSGGLTPELRSDMLQEVALLFLDVFKSGGSVADLFTADYTFLNGRLAQYYGLPGVTGDAFQRVSLQGTNRLPGVMGVGAFLTNHAQPENSSPVQRAFVVRERLLCEDLPPVPGDLDTMLQLPADNVSNRERYSQHSSDPTCNRCHRMIDPIGFTLENYDGFGRFRDTEAGQPIDSSGGIQPLPPATGSFIELADGRALAEYVASAEGTTVCAARFMQYFAFGNVGLGDNSCTETMIRIGGRDNGGAMNAMLQAIFSSPNFTQRAGQ